MNEHIGQERVRYALLLSLLVLMTGMAAAQQGSGVSDLLADTFLPAGSQITGPQGIIFGVLLPFMIVFVLFYAGMRSANRRMDVFSNREIQVLALAITLFLIPSGGYRLISGIFFTLFGLGAEQIYIPGVEGVTAQPLPFIGTVDRTVIALIFATISGALMYIVLSSFTDRERPFLNDLLVLGAFLGVFLGLAGISIIGNVLGWVVLLVVGGGLLYVYQEVRTDIAAIFGLFGLIAVAWALRIQEAFPEPIQAFGRWIITTVQAVVVILGLIFSILTWLGLVNNNVDPEPATVAAAAVFILSLIIAVMLSPV